MKLLIVCNFQNDFINGSLGFPRAMELEPKIRDLIPTFEDIIYIMNEHDESYPSLIEGMMVNTPHCIKDTEGIKMPESIKALVKDEDIVFKSNTFSSLDITDYLKSHTEFDEIYVAGLYSHTDVLTTAILSRITLPKSRVTVLKEYTDSFDKSLEQKAFNILNSLFVEVK